MWLAGVLLALALVCGCGKTPRAAPGAEKGAAPTPPAGAPRVLMIVAHRDFRDEELAVPRNLLQQAGYRVVLACSQKGTARGMLGAEVPVDTLVAEAHAADYAAVVFVGGTGAREYWDDPAAQRLAREAAAQGKVVGAICLAPVTLANAGLLKGKKATVWPSEAGRLRAQGAQYTGAAVEVDGRIVTAPGPEAAREFAQRLLSVLRQP